MPGIAMFAAVADLLLAPVQLAIYLLFVLALVETGRLVVQCLLRLRGREAFRSFIGARAGIVGPGYPIARLHAEDKALTVDDLDLAAMKRLELIRIATRITPMLGLIATLIPMGPALLALTKNDVAQMSELLRSAFSAVVLALAASCLAFWVSSVRRRWCAEEVLAVRRRLGAQP